jgi:hypothetical protein
VSFFWSKKLTVAINRPEAIFQKFRTNIVREQREEIEQ